MDRYEAAQEYKQWMEDREKIMQELAPSSTLATNSTPVTRSTPATNSTNEGCCDEGITPRDTESVPEDGESETETPKAQGESEVTDKVDEGLIDSIKSVTNWYSEHFGKDKKLWEQVV